MALPHPESVRPRVLACAVWMGFTASVPLWLTWYITHLPWLHLSEQVALPVVLGAWIVSLVLAARLLGTPSLGTTALGGLVSSLVGLLILGSKLVAPASEGSPEAGSAVPNALWITLGFLVLGGILGLAAGAMARAVRREASPVAGTSAGMAFAAVIATAPLLFAGGLVTSADAGMAVPDWPNTFGTNMFLYPLGPRVQPVVGETYANIYLEHAHRLFGALVGLASLCLTVWVVAKDHRRWVKVITVAVFAFIVFQGLLGGQRVVLNQRVLAMFHGVSAQLIFAGLVAITAFLTPSFQSTTAPMVANHRRIRSMTAAAVHAGVLQLFLGAMYRHFRDGPGGGHALWSHVGFSFVVLTLGVIGSALASGVEAEGDENHPLIASLRRAGRAAIVLVGIQFALGWAALFLGGKGVAAPTAMQAVLRTAHQANGALMLAAFTFSAVYARRLSWVLTRSKA